MRFVSFKECVVVLIFCNYNSFIFQNSRRGSRASSHRDGHNTSKREREKRETTFVFKILKCQIGPCLNNSYIGPTPGSGKGEGEGMERRGGFWHPIYHTYLLYIFILCTIQYVLVILFIHKQNIH